MQSSVNCRTPNQGCSLKCWLQVTLDRSSISQDDQDGVGRRGSGKEGWGGGSEKVRKMKARILFTHVALLRLFNN